MKILVINAGSSSLKYQLIDMNGEVTIAKGLCERIGIDGKFTHKVDGKEFKKDVDMPDHTAAFAQVKEALTEGEGKVINDLSEVTAVGHRAVQGGTAFAKSVRITDEVIGKIKEYQALAPLHNPATIKGIEASVATFGPDVPQVAVFDTAFHQTMPEVAYLWGIPYELYEKHGIRRYGFHGTSHRFVSARCCELLGKPDGKGTRIITCHLGNGSSVTAVKGGKSIDTSMGFTPLEGMPMGTRCGSMDPAIVTYLMGKKGMDNAAMDTYMNKKSGMLGLSGLSSDFRDLDDASKEGNERAALAVKTFCYQVKKLIGGYAAAMNGVDAIVFTAGVGENDRAVREQVLTGLDYLGVKVDFDWNMNCPRGEEAELSTADSSVKVFVIPTDEEMVIARDTARLAKK